MSDDDKVGYGKPPKAHRFKKGQSGNPKGRPKGTRNLATMVRDALSETVIVNIDGKRKKVSKVEAAFIQQANKAAGGDPKAVKLMIDLLLATEQRAEAQATNVPVKPDE